MRSLLAQCGPLRPLLALLLFSACDRKDVYGEADFKDNVQQAYSDCDPGEIKFLTGKHALSLMFGECGSNRFAQTSWSPNGTLLYFQLAMGGHILIGEEKRIETVPLETPVGRGAWIRDGVLALILPPEGVVKGMLTEEQARKAAETATTGFRLSVYDRTAASLQTYPLTIAQPAHLQAFGDGRQLVLTGRGEDGLRRVYRFSPDDGSVHPIVPQIASAELSDLVFVPEANLVAWSNGQRVEILRISDGTSVQVIEGVKRAIPHYDGRYVALELDGAEIGMFDQEAWGDQTAEQEQRDQRRREQFLKNLPDWAPRTVVPPELQILDLKDGSRHRISAWYGDRFEWFKPRPYWCSQVLWGVEGKQLNSNVAIVDLREKLRMIDEGDLPFGMELVSTNSPPPVSGDPIAAPSPSPTPEPSTNGL